MKKRKIFPARACAQTIYFKSKEARHTSRVAGFSPIDIALCTLVFKQLYEFLQLGI